jgi:hypothetical protein
MGSVVREVIVDCRRPDVVAAFWGVVLEWGVHERGVHEAPGDVPDVRVRRSRRPGLLLAFVPVIQPKTSKNRVHLDVCLRGCDHAEEVDRLVSLGASPVDVGQGDVPWVVLADPEGKEFCVLARRVG